MVKAQRLKSRSNSAFRLIYHSVLVTKFRHDTLTGEMIERLEDIFDLTLSKWDCELIEFGGATTNLGFPSGWKLRADYSRGASALGETANRMSRTRRNQNKIRMLRVLCLVSLTPPNPLGLGEDCAQHFCSN